MRLINKMCVSSGEPGFVFLFWNLSVFIAVKWFALVFHFGASIFKNEWMSWAQFIVILKSQCIFFIDSLGFSHHSLLSGLKFFSHSCSTLRREKNLKCQSKTKQVSKKTNKNKGKQVKIVTFHIKISKSGLVFDVF